MDTSQSIKEIATALSRFQKEVSAVVKDSANPFFKSKYATLENIISTIREPLAKNGLSFSQFPTEDNALCTILMHTSGEWLKATMKMVPVKNDPQGQGSALTYARRYALSAVLGIATEDDDGNAASNTGGPQTVKRAPRSEDKTAAATESTPKQKARIVELLKALGEKANTKKACEDAVFDLTDLALEEPNYPDIISRLSAMIAEREEGTDKDIS